MTTPKDAKDRILENLVSFILGNETFPNTDWGLIGSIARAMLHAQHAAAADNRPALSAILAETYAQFLPIVRAMAEKPGCDLYLAWHDATEEWTAVTIDLEAEVLDYYDEDDPEQAAYNAEIDALMVELDQANDDEDAARKRLN